MRVDIIKNYLPYNDCIYILNNIEKQTTFYLKWRIKYHIMRKKEKNIK